MGGCTVPTSEDSLLDISSPSPLSYIIIAFYSSFSWTRPLGNSTRTFCS